MRIRNFATSGLFIDGRMINSGSIQLMENEAIRMIMSGQAENIRISVFDIDGDTVVEKMPILSYRLVVASIFIVNMLADAKGVD